ncbi:MAG: diadenylate cyclase CdaA [Bacteroidaceae bacterium]|nr:diadenylate cyclase CdaA [Bacteroidaceae bacterium]
MEYFAGIGIKDVIDILCVALLLFYLYKMMRMTGSLNMFIGILVFVCVWILVTQVFKMQLLGAIMNKLVDVGVLAIIVLFADDIRRFFREIGTHTRTKNFVRWLTRRKSATIDLEKWQPVVKACFSMSRRKEGALIVIDTHNELKDIEATGELVNADINQLLIENIFFKNSPLHDGAMVVADDKIKSAACILPISQTENLPKSFGLRHRAAMGITQKSSAVAIVVSEETGRISIFNQGKYRLHLNEDDLAVMLADTEKIIK